MGATQDATEVRHQRPGRELNATKHGILSRHAVLPWEDRAEFDALLAALVGDHAPEGATERHLVEELAVIIWRKQRVLLAEAASHRAGLRRCLDWDRHGIVCRALSLGRLGAGLGEDPGAAVAARPGGTEAELEQLVLSLAGIRDAMAILGAGGRGAYEDALAALGDDIRDGWCEALLEGSFESDEDDPCRPDAAGLLRYLENESGWLRARRQEIEDRLQVRSQALGEAFDAERLDKVARYEALLDRKMGRTLAVLLKLQEMRRTITAPAA